MPTNLFLICLASSLAASLPLTLVSYSRLSSVTLLILKAEGSVEPSLSKGGSFCAFMSVVWLTRIKSSKAKMAALRKSHLETVFSVFIAHLLRLKFVLTELAHKIFGVRAFLMLVGR